MDCEGQMPSEENITRPISLISRGRSGTSLVMNILKGHPDMIAVGETAQMVFGVWHSLEKSKGIIRPDPILGGVDNHDARCGKAVRAAMLATFPDTGHKEWMQKPINMPWVMRHFPKAMKMPARGAWYWNAFHESFPDSRNITILRHPYDVVLSSMDYWKVPQRRAWVGIVEMAQVIDHPDSNIDYAISHDDGLNRKDWPEADVVVIGVSRSGKTPLSIYLSVLGYKAANMPIVAQIRIPPELYQLPRRRVVGLTIDLDKLLTIRRQRSRQMGMAPATDYTHPAKVADELELAERVCLRGRFRVIDVTHQPIEAIADEVVRYVGH